MGARIVAQAMRENQCTAQSMAQTVTNPTVYFLVSDTCYGKHLAYLS